MPIKDNKWLIGTGCAVVVIGCFLLAWGPIKHHFYDKAPVASQPIVVGPAAVIQTDPLCQYVEGLGLKCLLSPAEEGLMGPGHYVKYAVSAANHARVPIPDGTIFDQSCFLNGTKPEMVAELLAELKGQETTNRVPFDEITFKLDKDFHAGAELPVPKLADLKLKAGPKMTEVQDISIKAPNAWVEVIDENRFIDLIAQSAITEECVNRLIQRSYSVVQKAAFAQNYEIIVNEKAGQSFALSAAVKKGQIDMNGGGESQSAIDAIIKKSSAIPVVIGVDFFDPVVFQNNRGRLVAPAFNATGQVNALAKATGDRGILWQQNAAAPFGQEARLNGSGTGPVSPYCGGGTPSTANLTSSVVQKKNVELPDSASFAFVTLGTFAGGVSTSSGSGQNPFVCRSNLGRVEAQISFHSIVETVVKSDSATTLQIVFNGVSSPAVQVKDWNGKVLEPKSTSEGGLNMTFPLAGAGVYEVRVAGNRILSSHGGGTQEVNQQGNYTITVH